MKTGHDKIINYLKSIKKRRKYIYLVNDHLIHEIIIYMELSGIT